MLRGRYEHSLDAKGRLSIPARFRDHIAKRYSPTFVLTNFDRCLVGYPLEEWETLERQIAALPQLKPEVKAFQRFFLSGASECAIDRQGRILIPQSLRNFAAIKTDCVLIGLSKKFELWSNERWQKEFASAQKNFEGMSHAVGDLGL